MLLLNKNVSHSRLNKCTFIIWSLETIFSLILHASLLLQPQKKFFYIYYTCFSMVEMHQILLAVFTFFIFKKLFALKIFKRVVYFYILFKEPRELFEIDYLLKQNHTSMIESIFLNEIKLIWFCLTCTSFTFTVFAFLCLSFTRYRHT